MDIFITLWNFAIPKSSDLCFLYRYTVVVYLGSLKGVWWKLNTYSPYIPNTDNLHNILCILGSFCGRTLHVSTTTLPKIITDQLIRKDLEAFPFHLEIPCGLGDVGPSLCSPLMLYYADHVNTSRFSGQIWNYQGGKWAKCKGHSELLLSWFFLFPPQEYEHCKLGS